MAHDSDRSGPHLRHHAARRRAVAGDLAQHPGEGRDRPAARAARRRRDRGRLPDHLARRLRGGRGDRPHGRGPGDLRARAHPQGRHRRRLGRDQGRRAAADPHLHLDLRHPHRPTSCRPTARTSRARPRRRSRWRKSYCDDVEFSPMDATRADVEFTAEVCAIAVAEGATVINIPDTVGYTTPEEYARYFARLYELVPGAARRRALGPLPRRPRARGRQLLRRACSPARARSSARSTGSASGPATARSRRS